MSMQSVPVLPSRSRFEHVRALARDPLGFLERVRAAGPVVAVRAGLLSLVMVHDPAAVRRVLVERADVYRKTTRGYHKLRLTLGNGLITSEGEFWRRQRRIANPAFHRKALAGFAEIMGRVAEETADRLLAAGPGPVDVTHAMNHLALEVVAEALFGTDLGARARVIEGAVTALVEPFWKFTTAPYPWPEFVPSAENARFWWARWRIRRMLGALVDEARARGEGSDLLSMLMAARDPESGEAMSDAQLRDEGITLIGAGHETTANALAFALDLLGRYPEVQARVAEEADLVVGDGRPSADAIGALSYTRQVLQETLRLFPPVWTLARRSAEDDELGGFAVPAGTFVVVPVFSVHRDPALWVDPERFDPERFAEGAVIDRGAYLPFSRGQRQCIGDRFAMMEAACALAMFMRRFRVEAVGDGIELLPTLTLRSREPVRVRVVRREV
ncbi:MAG: cytochrome P450 [bacterium]